MHKNLLRSSRSLATLFAIFIFGSYIIVAQSPISGDWKARTKDESSDKIHISFSRTTEKGGKNQNGNSYSYSELQGLGVSQTVNGDVRFSLIREAGNIECEGTFIDGKGSGTFRFVPSAAFVSSMQSRGFDFTKTSGSKRESSPEERLFAAATLNVTTALADDLRSANFADLDVDDLFKAAIFKIDGKFMAEMKATGFPNLTMEDLVKARIFKIDTDYVREIKDMGFGVTDFENLVKYRIFKVTPEYLSELRNEGLIDLQPEQVVQLRIFKVDAVFVREARAKDPNISVDKIVQKKIGVWTKE